MKILNLYSCIGGNRAHWPAGADITAVEIDAEVARFYGDRFPNDTVIVGDAVGYLVEHYQEYDFIWASPPCQNDGQYRYNVGYRAKGYAPVMPSLMMYRIPMFLDAYDYQGWYAVENTKPFYNPLMPPQKVGRHLFWANFHIPDFSVPPSKIRSRNKIGEWEKYLGISLKGYAIKNKRQHMRNAVNSALGLHVLNSATGAPEHNEPENLPLFATAPQPRL